MVVFIQNKQRNVNRQSVTILKMEFELRGGSNLANALILRVDVGILFIHLNIERIEQSCFNFIETVKFIRLREHSLVLSL
jgi:hypothetical protein